ncbi:hypothetical protein [Bythopirellula polymerisocia]|uniref:Uncharacterized protein n=1 Tax=Bythopirellula polymerisocia TaxID=2528003 RepID=A0A5C6CML6_9BACT|nr:hypothetical protein [Bythopirellula polymerisocia]TWU25612.1 hypothetical protein Pla144_28190 [Bythopirellula polymerisocia]
MIRQCCGPLILLLTLALTNSAQCGEFDQLLAKVPASANTLVLIDVEQTLQSPLAQQEGWGKKLELAYVERPIFLPPEAKKLVLAAALQPSDDFSQLWELGVMELSESVSMRSIARSEGGYLDTIDGSEAAWTPSDAYFVELSRQELGVMFPAERQFVSRWLSFAKKNTEVALTDYLKQATRLTNEKVQILMAIDLANVVQPHEVIQKIEASPLLKKTGLSAEEIVPLLTSLQGATLRVAVGKDVQAQLRVDFASDIAPLEPVAKELVLSVLGDLGANISDLESWKLSVKDRAIHMEGPLSQDGQRRVFSVIELPSTKFSQLKDSTGESQSSEETPESEIREASLVYFRSIDVLIKDLRRDLKGNKASAAVMERYSRKIDRMPILNVDPELLEFGAQLATTLRSMALSKRQGGIDYGTATAGMGGGGYSNYSIDYGYFGNLIGDAYGGARASAADRSAARAQAMAASNNARVEGFKLIDDATAAIRRKMTQKYQVEF